MLKVNVVGSFGVFLSFSVWPSCNSTAHLMHIIDTLAVVYVICLILNMRIVRNKMWKVAAHTSSHVYSNFCHWSARALEHKLKTHTHTQHRFCVHACNLSSMCGRMCMYFFSLAVLRIIKDPFTREYTWSAAALWWRCCVHTFVRCFYGVVGCAAFKGHAWYRALKASTTTPCSTTQTSDHCSYQIYSHVQDLRVLDITYILKEHQ